MIIDEGYIRDKIEVELANEKLINDLYYSIKQHYPLNSLISRTRNIHFKDNPKWNQVLHAWKFGFSANCFKEIYNSISPLPIDYKQESLKFLFDVKHRGYNQRKMGVIKKMIVESLLKNPRTIDELSKELMVKHTTISSHIRGSSTYSICLIKRGIVEKIGEKNYRKGGYARADLFGIKDIDKAKEFISK